MPPSPPKPKKCNPFCLPFANLSLTLPCILFIFFSLIQQVSSIQLCLPSSASYPCSACQPYATLKSGLCYCNDGYYMATDLTYQYCDLCHSSCKTCYGPLSTNCITCPSGFTFVNDSATCSGPNTVNESVITQAYSIQGFTPLTGWTFVSFASPYWYQCSLRTILGGTTGSSTNSIRVSLSSLPNHFRIRVKAQFYFFNALATTGKTAIIRIGSATNSTPVSNTNYAHQTCTSTVTYTTTAVDVTLLHSGSTALVQFLSSAAVGYGIRDVIITVWKCASNCSTCNGFLATQCTGCTDTRRTAYEIVTYTCQCTGSYYQQPYAGTCVDICPSVPIKHYGDNTTRNCVTSCPTGYAYDDLYLCRDDCPVTSALSTKALYRDDRNKICVEICPATEPYGDPVNRRCYAECPSPRFGVNVTDKICVAWCPHTYRDSGIYKTYSSGRLCLPYCPDGTWADPVTSSCKFPCSGTFALMDNSTGQNLCVSSCPPPNRFASSGYCIQICPTGQYGDITNWQCTATCTAPNWGMQSYNRKCVPTCPNNTWAKTSNRRCVNTTLQCGPQYANNYSRSCVNAIGCSYGTYADPDTYSCVTYCPSGRYGNPDTRVCELQCVAPYFRDPGVNLCVTSCVTDGLYADQSSSRTCVASCNSSGATPWADDSNRTCMADCNQTIATYLADNSSFKCVFQCPLTHVADFTTLTPKCVTSCPTGWYADATPVTYRICVKKCSTNPPQFGDPTPTVGGVNLCVDVCSAGSFGDQTGNRLCKKTCPAPYYAQNDGIRRCVRVCNQSSYGYQETCTYHVTNCEFSYKRVCYQDPHSCPTDYFGDNSTNLCVNPCPASQATFGDILSKLCVRSCPDNPNYTASGIYPHTFYADISNRQCVLRCSSTYSPPLFGNNASRTCQSKCLDFNSYSQPQSTYRICVDRCWPSPTFAYANNLTKTCGTFLNCPSNYYGQNSTQLCVQFCPSPQWAFKSSTRRVCLDICPSGYVGDDSTGKRVCVPLCPTVPDRYADLNLRICVDMCNSSLYGQPITRTCTGLCPAPLYYSYQPTRRCIQNCPSGYFADDRATVRKCQPASSLCTGRFGDAYLRKCVGICTGPSPVDTFGSGSDCVSFCPNGTYADSYSSSRLCVGLCPPGVLNSVAAPNLYGDPTTHTCVAKCITPNTWADYQTRLCQPVCSATPIPTYSQNFLWTCVTALNCPAPPTYPTLTFGDNTTRSCVSFCSNSWWGDPTSRNCVSQCPNVSTTGTSRYYGDNSTGQYLCVVICPTTPRSFGQNDTNLCVSQCPALTYGDQTGNRSCVPQCPQFGSVNWYAQNLSRICVLVCKNDTWGLGSTRECVESPFDCGSQWADDSTHLCVTTCPAISNLFGDSSTRKCVEICPNGTFADDLTRQCKVRCPQNNGVHDTFGNNDTHICQQFCTQDGAYADPQTLNRYCVINCSQYPTESFADPSTKSCVPRCPTFPSLFGQVDNFKCVSSCISPYFADSHSRRCVANCDATTEFKLRNPRSCVTLCPSSDNLFGDSGTGFCQTVCSSGYRYAVLRICVPSCTAYGLFDYDGTCVKYCPYTYYADTAGHCVNPCPLATLFGENTTTTCRTTCITGYAYNRLCVAICPDNLWGYNGVCQSSCPAGTASNISNLCIGLCDANTYRQGSICVTNCTTLYADPNTRLCSSPCTLNRYADPSTHTCVQVCPPGSYRDPSYTCKTNCSPLRADNLTNSCTGRCSNGTWGHNNLCVNVCPSGFYGYQVDRDCYNIANIPDSTLFADNVTQTWVAVCSQNPQRYGDGQSHQCVVNCTAALEYADPVVRQCKTACTNTSYYLDPTTKTCVMICPQGYFANPQNGKCESDCTLGRFNYLPTHFCVTSCPKPYYGYQNTSNNVCVQQCPSLRFAEDDLCKSGCTLPLVADSVTHRCVSSCIDSFYSSDAGACVAVSVCSTYSKIADNSTNRCVPLCPTDPDLYQQNGICVVSCAIGTYSDPTTNVRICTSLCTEGLYGDPVSGRCVAKCIPGYYAFNDTNLCLQTCPNGYADNETGYCHSDCPAPTFADTLNNRCMRICSNGQFGQGRICVPMCSQGLYGNPITMQCQSGCPSFDYSFAQNTTNLCVRNCSIVPNSYADRGNNFCMDNCTRSNQYMLDVVGICTSLCPQGQFMQNSTKRCQTGCTTGYAQPTSRFCVLRCFGNPQTFAYEVNQQCVFKCNATQNLYADNNTNYCVEFDNCTRSPETYSDPISRHCVLFCPEGLYAQDTTYTCTTYCVTGFADNFKRKCVADCPESQETYGDPNTHTCVKVCPDGWFANNATQRCVLHNNCPPNTYSDILSKHCVGKCPPEPQHFALDLTTSCVPRCPSSSPELYGDVVTQKCIWPCTSHNGQIKFADPISQTCVFVCPIQLDLYGDPTTGKCTTSCDPLNPYKDNSTQRCVAVCPSNPDYYAYDFDFTCVRVCPTGLYASDPVTRICSSTCQPWLTFKDETTNRCVAACPIPYFADNSTYECVLGCPPSPDYFADPHTRTCVLDCPDGPNDANGNPQWIQWQQQVNRTCVTRCPPNLFAQNSSGRCTSQCPTSQYADPIIQVCVADCTVRPGFYKSTGPRTCVKTCPPNSHKYEPTHTCLNMTGSISGCPGSYFANQLQGACTLVCPFSYFADLHTKFCRLNCTNGQYADPVDRVCRSGCTTSPNWFAYDGNMTCVQYCPDGLFSQNKTWTCTSNCPNYTNGTVLYSYQITMQCVITCSIPYYSYIINQTCLLICPSGWYANDETRQCSQTCSGTYNADSSTNRCVQICPTSPNYYALNNVCIPSCPNGTYKDNSTRSCVNECPFLPLTFADDSRNQCVMDCPSTPNYFADNETRKCVANCSQGTFADTSTRTCVMNCPIDSTTYADPLTWVCQPACTSPYYASSLTNQCVDLCPNLPVKTYAQDSGRFCTTRCMNTLFGNNDTRKCQSNCLTMTNAYADTTTNLCVTTCPVGFFAHDPTHQCRRDCPGLFADSTTRKCVANCPGTERLFADPTTETCVYLCPLGRYGNTDTWTCQTSCANVAAGYVLEVERRCVPQCPSPYFALTGLRICVQNCGTGLYGNQITRQCQNCPSVCLTCLSSTSCLTCTSSLYLQYGACVPTCTLTPQIANYANSFTMACVGPLSCPPNTFANNATISCSPSCPPQMYGNVTTKTCQPCPSTCTACLTSTYCTACIGGAELATADNVCYAHCSSSLRFSFEGVCQAACPAGSYEDFTGVYCQACNAICLTCYGSSMNCTSCDGIYKYQNSCVTQCPTGYYGQNATCNPCTSSIPSCTQPLTFTTTTTVQNYQQVIIIKFNQNATIKSDPSTFINVNLKVTRRRLDSSGIANIVNNGIAFTSQILPDGTIKLTLKPGISLSNAQYTVSFSNGANVVGQNGGTLQNLEDSIEIKSGDVYADGDTYNAPLVIAGKILAIGMIGVSFIAVLFGITPLYLVIEAFQISSLFAYSKDLAPNFFYFLKQLRLCRFHFIPSIFSSIYIQPQSYVAEIPQKVLDVQGHLSFALNATQGIYFIFLFLIMAAVVFAFTSRINGNRPLKNLFIKVWETRIKWGIFLDFVWMFGIQVFVSGFLQFRYKYNGGEIALAVIFILIMLTIIIGLFVNAVKKYRSDPQSITLNYSPLLHNTKQSTIQKFLPFMYPLRFLLFCIILSSTLLSTTILSSLSLALFSVTGLLILIFRPYREHIHNIIHLLNEFFLGFLAGGIIFYTKMLEKGQPSGAKITNGFILTIMVIIHLSVMLAWALYSIWIYWKQIRQGFKESQFYKLYLDEEYDQILEKQISELNQEEKGEVESIQVTNIGGEGEERDGEDEVIRLKIKRRVKKEKFRKEKMGRQGEEEHKQVNDNERNQRKQGNYVKVNEKNENYYKLKSNRKDQQNDYQQIIFDQEPNIQSENELQMRKSPKQQSKQNQWIKLERPANNNNNNRNGPANNFDKRQVENQEGYQESKLASRRNASKNDLLSAQANNKEGLEDLEQILDLSQQPQKQMSKLQYSPILDLSPQKQRQKAIKLQKQQKAKQKILQNQKKMRQTFKSSFADFDESNFFVNENNKEKPEIKQQKINNNLFQAKNQKQQKKEEREEEEEIYSEQLQQPENKDKNKLIQQQQDEPNNEKVPSKQMQGQQNKRQQQQQEQICLQPDQQQLQSVQQSQQDFLPNIKGVEPNLNFNVNANKDEQLQPSKKQKQKQNQWRQLNNNPASNQQSQSKQQQQQPQQHQQKQQQPKYKVFDFDQLELDNQPQQPQQQQQQNQKQQQKQKNKEKLQPQWSVQVEDLDEDKNQDEQERERKEKSKKMHLMLFEDQEEDQEQQ